MSYRKTIPAAICLLTIIAFGAFIASGGSAKSIVYASSVNGVGTGIYWDQACTNRTLSLPWGSVEAGSNTTLTIYIKNEGNSAAPLSLETSNWNPSAAINNISLKWNYSGQVLSAGQVIPVELTLTVCPTVSGITNFSFDTIITTNQS
ncbi:MAG: hypothetical protein ABSF65_03005 [Candidatus Bathyarchaeia archaeon]|jgi:hypothetical protein